jgi:transposase-like protein
MKVSRAVRRKVTRERRRMVAGMLERGAPLAEIARACGCSVHTVRQHVRALREQAQKRAVSEWGPAAGPAADLVEAMEAALQKFRSAQEGAGPGSANYRKLVWMEMFALRQLLGVRRELVRAQSELHAAEASAADNEVGEFAQFSDEEVLEMMERLGLPTDEFRRMYAERDARAACIPRAA